MELGRIGIWTNLLDSQPATKAQETMAQLEELGFGAVWIPESRGRESFTKDIAIKRVEDILSTIDGKAQPGAALVRSPQLEIYPLTGVDSATAFNDRLIRKMKEQRGLREYLQEDFE